jgi:chemotaxis protein MotB
MRIQRLLGGIVLVMLLVTALGCQDQSLIDANNVLKQENQLLRKNLNELSGTGDDLNRRLTAAEASRAAAQLDADQWQAKYDALKALRPEGGGVGLPPELMKKFVDLARSGGPWILTETGGLKASTDILFASGKIELKTEGKTALADVAPKLKEILTDSRVVLRIDGHTDSQPIKRSGWKDNLHLSLMRAWSVMNELIKDGIAPERMYAAGFGMWNPVTSNNTKEGRSQNRRVELHLVAAPGLLADSGVPREPE